MGAKAHAIEAGRFGVDEALLGHFVPMNGLAAAHISQLVPFAGVSELHPGDSIPTNFKTSDQAYYVVSGELELYTGAKLAGTVKGGTEAARFPLSHLQTSFDSAHARGAVRLLRVDRARVSALLILEEPSAGATTHRRATQSPLDSRQIIARLLKSQIFSHIPPANVQRLLELAEPVQVHAGDVVIRQGERGNYCYILMEGRCSVTQRAQGEILPRTLGELGPGDSFGEEVLGGRGVRRSTVTMRSDGWLRRLSKAQFAQLAGKTSMDQVSWREAQKLVSRGAKWLDVRLPDEHRNDGLSGSLNLPLAELGGRSRELNRKVPYVVCCNTGQRSIAAAILLREQGFSVCVLEDGLMARDVRGGSSGSVEDLKAQLVLADAEIRTAMQRKAQADAAREAAAAGGQGMSDSQRVRMRAKSEADAARANEALAAAKRRKLELQAMVRAMEAKAANERQQAESVVEQLRQQTDVRLRQEKDRLQNEFLDAAGAMDDLKRAQTEAELHFQKERERLEAQIEQARAAMSIEADRIRNEVESAKRAAAEKAERIRREQTLAEQQLRSRTEARLLAERRKLESEFNATMNSVRKASQDVSSAENAKREAQRKADELSAKLRAAEEKARRGGGAASPARQEAGRRLEEAHRARRDNAARKSTPSNVVPFKGPGAGAGADSDTFDPSNTMVALRTELHSFEDKVSEASERIDSASRARAEAQRAQLLVEERLARQRALEEETRLTLYEEAENWLEGERSRDGSAASKEKERKRAKAKAAESQRQAKASEDLMSDVKSQLSGDFDDGASSIEHSLRLREMEQQAGNTKAAPKPERDKAEEERKKAKEALDRAREHVQRLKNRYDKD